MYASFQIAILLFYVNGEMKVKPTLVGLIEL